MKLNEYELFILFIKLFIVGNSLVVIAWVESCRLIIKCTNKPIVMIKLTCLFDVKPGNMDQMSDSTLTADESISSGGKVVLTTFV